MKANVFDEAKRNYLIKKGWVELAEGNFIPPFESDPVSWNIHDAYLEAIKSELKESELTSLPEKWCIKITKENFQELFKLYLYDELILERETIGRYLYPTELSVKTAMSLFLYYGYTEITTEQFRKWVLKEETKPTTTKTDDNKKQFLLDLGYTFNPNGNIELRDKITGGCIGFGSIDAAYDYAKGQIEKPSIEFVEDERKFFGYKFKEQYKSIEKHAYKIAYPNGNGTKFTITHPYFHFGCNSIAANNLKEAGILDIWFEPVFEEVKEVDNENKSRELIFNHNKRMIQLEFKLKETLDLVLKAKIDYAG